MQPGISIVALGVYRHVAATMSTTFQGTPFHMAAILDLMSEPQVFNYNSHNLGVVLHTLEPRPQVFITGAAITESMTNESIRVWDEYVKKLGVKNTLVINVNLPLEMLVSERDSYLNVAPRSTATRRRLEGRDYAEVELKVYHYG